MISLDRPAWPRPSAAESDIQPLAKAPLETESSFYGRYAWCLDVFPTVRDVTRRLQDELSRQGEALKDWQRQEVALNAFMLSCAVADAVDDFTAGESFDFSPAAVLPGMRALTSAVERGLDAWRVEVCTPRRLPAVLSEHAGAIVERLRGRTAAAAFAQRHHAGTATDHIGRYRLLAERGVRTVFVSLPDLDGPDDVLRLAPVAAAFA